MSEFAIRRSAGGSWREKARTVVRTALIGITLSLPVMANAAPQWCLGVMSNLYVTSSGGVYVMVSWSGQYIAVCNVNQNLGSVSPTTCMGWLSLMRSAVQRQSQTIVQYSDAPACSAMPTYDAAPVPSYVMMAN